MKKRELECLQRLNDRTSIPLDIVRFLGQEKVINPHTVSVLLHTNALDLTRDLYQLFIDLAKEERVQLIDFNWQLLPIESITITIITNHTKKDFTWSC